jgi:hypothetical protein
MRRLYIALFVVVAGCATVRQPAPTKPAAVAPSKGTESAAEGETRRSQAARPTYNLTGYPPAVRDGYIDGCETAKRTPFGRKDGARMQSDPQYSMGWNDGFQICQKK